MKDYYIIPFEYDLKKQKKFRKFGYLFISILLVVYITLGVLLYFKKAGNNETIVFEDYMSFALNILLGASAGFFWSSFFTKRPPFLKLEDEVFYFRSGILNKIRSFKTQDIDNFELKFTQLHISSNNKSYKIDCSNYPFAQIQEIKKLVHEINNLK